MTEKALLAMRSQGRKQMSQEAWTSPVAQGPSRLPFSPGASSPPRALPQADPTLSSSPF